MLWGQVKERNLPELQSREEMLSILQNEIYGFVPDKPDEESFSVEKDVIKNFCGGKAVCNRVTANCRMKGKQFSFPFSVVLPTDGGKHPFFIHINFRDCTPDLYEPTEELIDNGFAVLSVAYQNVTSDDGDFTNGLAGVLFENGKREANAAGKIAMWAWAGQRIMDYAQELDEILDLNTAIVCGHSRLGKTALLAAALDERFTFAYSNDSGCSGAALARGKQGERVKDIYERFPFWFCENYGKYADREEEMPFDQHYLLAAISPRKVMIGSAQEDAWADPASEMLCCLAASPAFRHGFVSEDRFANAGEAFIEGDIGYHMRKGTHSFTREDWQKLIMFVRRHRIE